MGLLTARPLEKLEFHKSKMADGRHFKNRYIILSQQPFDWFLLNLARGDACWSPEPGVKFRFLIYDNLIAQIAAI